MRLVIVIAGVPRVKSREIHGADNSYAERGL
jgi:hypothetical protein